MSTIPYDAVRPASVATIGNEIWLAFMKSTVSLNKRQIVTAPISTEELIRMCPMNNVQNPDVAAGCIAGIYNRFCRYPGNAVLLGQCHDAYNRVFAASYFKPLGDVCPAWRRGPRSLSCAQAISAFSYNYFLGNDAISGQPVYLQLDSRHAHQLVVNIFANPTYAPCVASTCIWN